MRGPNNVGRAVRTDPTLLRYASAITEQKKCWELLAEKFDRFQTLRNNIQQHATGCANGRNMYHPTMLGVVGQQCCVRLHGALEPSKTKRYQKTKKKYFGSLNVSGKRNEKYSTKVVLIYWPLLYVLDRQSNWSKESFENLALAFYKPSKQKRLPCGSCQEKITE